MCSWALGGGNQAQVQTLGFAFLRVFCSVIFQTVSGNAVIRIPVPVAVQKPLTEDLCHRGTWRRQCQTFHQDTHTARWCLTDKSFSGKDPCAGKPREGQAGEGRLDSGGAAEGKAARSGWCEQPQPDNELAREWGSSVWVLAIFPFAWHCSVQEGRMKGQAVGSSRDGKLEASRMLGSERKMFSVLLKTDAI